MEYKVLNSQFIQVLEEQVNAHLLVGWQLQGGIFANDKSFFQAIFRMK
ncbi:MULTISPECIES: DUF1737 domain-containing protein [unclassified Chryseobacterium]|nr:DUF1737 domain-containing protein [Chryseobacterium sp. ON_d1]GEJ45808.1 hypothetical protein CRS_24160 [Chryseobacterium sp. ON_d1]